MNSFPFFDAVTPLLLVIDQWLLRNFNVSLDLVGNVEQLIVTLAAFIVIAFLVFFLLLDRSKNAKNPKSIETKNIESSIKLEPLSEEPNKTPKLEKSQKQEALANPKEDAEKTSEKPNAQNIYELDNGFVINKRNSELQHNSENENKNSSNLNVTTTRSVEPTISSDANSDILFNKLEKIEAEMLSIRTEYKSGAMDSLDYLSRTQSLYKTGEELVEEYQSSAPSEK
ncbi:hypothetical protein N9C75_04160 [Alphaproteobacteria bacterium]|nr:hypothetical protein [Alphaproteobacteria bacterium]